ncbi:MAG: helix-turn-helix domain-containing protein, partial [Candidatus Paceibacterota bacterium]
MSSDLFFDNKKYISAKEASILTSYTKDYIGQLCRSGKLDCKRIGRTWYVCEKSVLEYSHIAEKFDYSQNLKNSEKEISEEKKDLTKNFTKVEGLEKSQKSLETGSHLFSKTLNKLDVFIKSDLVQKTHKVVFSNNVPVLKSIAMISFSVLFLIGAFSLKESFVNLAKNTKVAFAEMKYVSLAISESPYRTYKAADDIVDLYSGELSKVYINIGDRILNAPKVLSDEIIVFVKNPPLYIVRATEDLALSSKKVMDVTLRESSYAIETANLKTFSFISDSFKNNSSEDFKNLSASALDSVKNDTITPVDESGILVYGGVNSFIEKVFYNPISFLLGRETSRMEKSVVLGEPALPKQNIPIRAVVNNQKVTNSRQTIINNTQVVERVTERIVPSGLTVEYLEQRLSEINNNISNRLSALSTGSGGNITNVYQQIAQSQRIDNLSNVTISNPTITGGSISTGSLSAGSSSLGTTTLTSLSVTGTGTTTFSGGGIDIATGCFAINGICVTGGGGGGSGDVGSGLSGQTVYYDANGTTLKATSLVFLATSTNSVGIGTTTPFANLSVNSTAGIPGFVVGSSTRTDFIIDASGNVGIGTSSPVAPFELARSRNGATVFNIINDDLGTNAWAELNISNEYSPSVSGGGVGLRFHAQGRNRSTVGAFVQDSGVIEAGTALSGGLSIMARNTAGEIRFYTNGFFNERMKISSFGTVGIGTSTPQYLLQLATTTRAQLALTGAPTDSPWTFRSIGNNLYISTSSPTTFATTSISALEIAGGGFGTTTVRGLNISGQATSTSNVGFNIISGCYAINGVCLGSGGGGTWGSIIGTLSDQTDLQTALNGKISVGTTSVNSITTLSNLSITKSQISDFGTYEAPLVFTYPLTRSLNTISLAFGTTTANSWSQLQTFSNGINVGGTTYTSLIPTTRTVTLNGTANQISSSAGSQDLSANRTWTLSLPNHVIFPSSFFATSASTTNSTTTSFAITGITSSLLKTNASGSVIPAIAGTDYLTSADIFAYPFPSNATSTTLTFSGGLLSTASSTFTGPLRLSSLSNGSLAVYNGLVSSGATTTAGTGLTYSANAFNVNTTQNISKLSNLTSNGFVKTTGGDGTLSIDTTTYQPSGT